MQDDINLSYLDKKGREMYTAYVKLEYAIVDKEKACNGKAFDEHSNEILNELRTQRNAYRELLITLCDFIEARGDYHDQKKLFTIAMNTEEQLVEQKDGSFKLQMIKKKKKKSSNKKKNYSHNNKKVRARKKKNARRR